MKIEITRYIKKNLFFLKYADYKIYWENKIKLVLVCHEILGAKMAAFIV